MTDSLYSTENYLSISKNVEKNGPFNEVGSFFKFYHYNLKKTIFLKITDFSTPINRKTYKCRFETIGTNIGRFPQIIEIQITIISPNKTFVSCFYSFDENIDNKEVK